MGGKGRKSSDRKPGERSGKKRKGSPGAVDLLAKASGGPSAAAASPPPPDTGAHGGADAAEHTEPVPVEFIDAIDVDLTSLDDEAPVGPRRTQRVPVSETVEVRGFFGLVQHRLANASLTGVFIETASPLDVGDAVEIGFARPDGRKVKVQGRVRWVTPFGGLHDARPGMGVELVGIDPEKRDLLAEIISRRR